MINELDKRNLPLVTLKVPNGERPDTHLEGYFGALSTPADEMPSDVDVEATVFIDFEERAVWMRIKIKS